MYDGDYDKAAEYFSDIINNGPFTLVDNIMDNFTAVNEFNSESILEVSYSTQYNTQYGPWSDATLYNIWGMNVCGSSTSWINTSPSLWLVENSKMKLLMKMTLATGLKWNLIIIL